MKPGKRFNASAAGREHPVRRSESPSRPAATISNRQDSPSGHIPAERAPPVCRRSRQRKTATGLLTNLTPKSAHEVWTREQWIRLAYHLHNGNAETDFIMGWFGPDRKNAGRPGPIYVKSRKTSVHKVIPWSWQSLCGKGAKKIAIVFYSKNQAGQSRWAGVDFDAHSGEADEAAEAQRQAFAFFRAALNVEGCYCILESSGRGWHVWLLAKEFRPCQQWTDMLIELLTNTGVPVEAVELFPPVDAIATKFSKGMRAPGCWSPSKHVPSAILFENISPIFEETRDSLSLKEKEILSLPSSLSLYGRLIPLLAEFAVVKVATRRKLLLSLTGQLFHQLSYDMARRFAVEHFARRRYRRTHADETEHLREFHEFWTGLHHDWLTGLTTGERTAFEKLTTDHERDAFRIIRSYHRKAIADKQPDFPIVRDDLAGRLGLTGPGAGLLVQRFCDAGILERTQEYVPHKSAARYRWLLPLEVSVPGSRHDCLELRPVLT